MLGHDLPGDNDVMFVTVHNQRGGGVDGGDEMKLGDLEFKPGDLDSGYIEEQANRILREKLGKAPELFKCSLGWVEHAEFMNAATKARLVCIEEIAGKESE